VLAEEVHVSGVLAVVVAGLWLGHISSRVQTSQSRLQTRAVWRLVEFLLEGYVFLLIGQQLPHVLSGLHAYSPGTVVTAVVATTLVALLVRPLWLLATSRLPARLHARLGGDPDQGNAPLSRGEVLALSWAGTRGVITLAAVFSLPDDFPQRTLLIVCAYVVVLVTLLGQGLTFAPLLRRLRLGNADLSEALARNQARVAALDAGLSRLDDLLEQDADLAELVRPLRRAAETRRTRYARRVAVLSAVEDDTLPVDERYGRAVTVRREMIDAEREELLAHRDSGRLSDASLRALQRELDHEESLLPAPPG
jgi:CPA1 family monovalent cation:H+ antiporter